MKVHGYEIGPDIISKVVAEMQRLKRFRKCHLVDALEKPPWPYVTKTTRYHHAIVDRIIQRERVAGRISMHRYPMWEVKP